MELILASSSAYRAELLSRLGLAFTQRAPGIDETRLPGEEPTTYVVRLAVAKARAPAATGQPVIGADQVAVLDGEVLGKPAVRAEAARQLRKLSDREAVFLTGLCLQTPDGRERTHCSRVLVRYRPLDDRQIHHYLDHCEALQCAAALRSEGLGIALLREIRGDDPTALIGLPLITLSNWLAEAGLDPLSPG